MNRGQRRASWLAQHRNMTRATRAAPRLFANAYPSASASVTSAPAAGRIHIEELVFHGFPNASAHSTGEAIQQELTRVLTVRGLPEHMTHDSTQFEAGSFQLPPGAKPKAIGAQIARAVYGGQTR